MKKVQLNPVGWMSQLSQVEVSRLQDATNSELFAMFRNCCLAVLNSGVDEDNFEALFAPYENFEIKLIRRERGVKIELVNPPEVAFVDENSFVVCTNICLRSFATCFTWVTSTHFFTKPHRLKVTTSQTWCLTCYATLKRLKGTMA